MESSERSDLTVSAPQVGVTKAIADLDELVQLMLNGLPRAMHIPALSEHPVQSLLSTRHGVC